jgi:hypothetical protein
VKAREQVPERESTEQVPGQHGAGQELGRTGKEVESRGHAVG